MVYYILQLVIVFGLTTPPPVPNGRLLTPDELSAEVHTRLLTGFRSLLTSTEDLRKHFESRTDADYRESIERLRKREADLKQQIAELEKARPEPRPAVRLPMSPGVLDPFDPANKPKPPPKPPVRD